MINLSKPIFIFYFLGLILIQSCSSKTNNAPGSGEEKEELLARIELFNSAFQKGEVEKLELMITNNYLHTNSSSKSIGRNDWVAYLKKRKKDLANGDLIVDNYKMDETQIEMYDDMAIVTAKISFSSKKYGELKESEIRITNVWVKEGGVWKRAGFHDTRIK